MSSACSGCGLVNKVTLHQLRELVSFAFVVQTMQTSADNSLSVEALYAAESPCQLRFRKE